MQSIRIVILPPWYLTVYAKIAYLFLLLWAVYLAYYVLRKKYESRKIKLQEKYKEDMYEGKLRFFTNITHEFSTPLTLIYGPCERILSYRESDAFIRKYAQIIKSNAERLHSLIQEIIDFRRMETGNKICRIEPIDVSRLTREIINSFSDLAEQNHIQFESNVDSDIQWNSDGSCYTKILNNLISNAFKYTPPRGIIVVAVGIENQNLIVKVYNTGKGIKAEDIPLIFNRYSILDNIKENSIKGLSSRNGLGLAICHSMTELLRGTIEVRSEIDRYAEFSVTLPRLEPDRQEIRLSTTDGGSGTCSRRGEQGEAIQKNYILVIDDNAELLWMLKDILSGEYRVVTALDGRTGLDILKQETPDLIITDVMMPNMDGITLTKQLKENIHTMHIPLVILSAKNTHEEKIAGLDSGADIYIPKPFDTEYLKTVVRNLIRNKKNLEAYYNSSASAFEFTNGQLLGKENRDFLRTVLQLIDINIANEDFSVELLARNMQISVRNLYRKFKELNLSTPNDFIKEQRLQYAGKLIKTTRLTIQEIMYKSGFTNQSHFYKEFARRFGKTPKEYRESNETKDGFLS
jgi:signal transduction histidine kinase/DNA-binding response OmpR family regulator